MVKIVYGDRVGKQGKVSVSATAIMFDDQQEKVLLTRRSDNGRWCLPGGMMDAGESIMETCLREVWEETGLEAQIKRLVGVYSSPHMLYTYADGNCYQMVNFVFEVQRISGDVKVTEETTEFHYFTPAEIETLDIMEHHRERLKDALQLAQPIILN